MPDSPIVSPTAALDKPKRAKLSHLLLDFNFADKDDLIQLAQKFGPAGCWGYTCLLLAMTQCNDSGLSRIAATQILRNHQIKPSSIKLLIDFCISKHMFDLEPDQTLSNSRVKRDQESLLNKRKEWKNKKSAYRMSQGSPRSVRGDMRKTLNVQTCEPEHTSTTSSNDLEKDPRAVNNSVLLSHEGRTERAPGVWLSEIEFEQGLLEYRRFDLNKAWAERGLLHTSRHLSQPQNSGKSAYAHWASWALRECLADQRAGFELKTSKERHGKALNGNSEQRRPHNADGWKEQFK